LVRPIPQTVVSTIAPLLTPVHPALFYTGLLHTGVRIEGALPLSLLRLGGVPGDLREELVACGGDAISVFEAIMKLDGNALAAVLPGIENRGGRDTVITEFLYAAVGPKADVQFAKAVFETLAKMFAPEVLLTMICADEFLQQPNFPCICYIFRAFVALLKRSGKSEFLDFVQVFFDPARQCFSSPFRTAAFRELDQPETIAKVLHEPE
jgi:hypothetical protein